MDIYSQARIALGVGLTTFILVFLSGIYLPTIISSTLPLFLISILVIIALVSVPVGIYSLIWLFIIKREIKRTKVNETEKESITGAINRKS